MANYLDKAYLATAMKVGKHCLKETRNKDNQFSSKDVGIITILKDQESTSVMNYFNKIFRKTSASINYADIYTLKLEYVTTDDKTYNAAWSLS